jgi:hypothetical protein
MPACRPVAHDACDGWKALEVNSCARLGRLLGFVNCGRIVPPRKLAVEEMG